MKNNQKIFNLKISASFFCMLLINYTQTEVPFTWMQGIYAITHSAYHHLSPIVGMIWAEQQIADQMYHEGDTLIKELFYLQKDMVSFRPTILKSKPASYWTPRDIGMIIAAITAYRESKEHNKEDLLHAALEHIMQPQRELMRIKEDRITELIATKKEILQDITQQNKMLFTLIGQAQRKKCTTCAQLVQKIVEIELLEGDKNFLAGTREPIEQEIKKLIYDRKFINRTLETGFTELIKYFLDSVKESAPDNTEQKYDPYTTEHILLTLLWKIANPQKGNVPKQDFVDYFNQLGAMIHTDNLQTWIKAPPYNRQDYAQYTGTFFLLIRHNSLTNVGSLSKQLAQTGFNQQGTHLSKINSDMREQYMAQQYEQAILATQGRSLWESAIPPIITDAGAMYSYLDGSLTEPSPGCVETSFRNFFDIILYNTEKKIFDIERLIAQSQTTKKIPLQLNNNVIHFYQRNRCITNLQASELYNTWADGIKNLSGVVYMKPKEYAQKARFYEVKSLFPNMLKICNHLLFGNNKAISQLNPEKQLDVICDALSRDDFMISWEIIDTHITKDMLSGIDYVTLKFFINNTYSFEWQLKNGHSVIPPTHCHQSLDEV